MQMTGSGVWRTYGAWGFGLGTLSPPLQAGLKLCRTYGAREEDGGAVQCMLGHNARRFPRGRL